ncbi:MAG: PEP-CTERM sorting domain-containing protein [bacterium]|nr:PEP-CTERM sorting domain-containing protein [bacterium]
MPRLTFLLIPLLVSALAPATSTAQVVRHSFLGTVADAGPDSPLAAAVGSQFEIVVEHSTDLDPRASTLPPPGGILGPDAIRTQYLETFTRDPATLGFEFVTPPVDFSILIDGTLFDGYERPATPTIPGPAGRRILLNGTPDFLTGDGLYEFDPETGGYSRQDLVQFVWDGLTVSLADTSASFLQLGAMPTDLDEIAFDRSRLEYRMVDSGILTLLNLGEITEIHSTIVPEPGTGLLVLLGLAGLARTRRR